MNIAPRVESEPGFTPRLSETAEPVPLKPRLARGGLKLAALGVLALVAALGLAWLLDLISGLLARGAWWGWPVVGLAALGGVLILGGLARELGGLLALRRIDTLRQALAAEDVAALRRTARRWLAGLEGAGDTAALFAGMEDIDQAEALRALLRAGPAARLRTAAEQLGRSAAWQAAAVIAATPSPGLDALVVGWRGVRLVRQVAGLYGFRPGTLATLALLRRTALAAASVAVTELAVNAASAALVSNPLLDRLLGDAAGAGVAARRMIVLARAAASACDPM